MKKILSLCLLILGTTLPMLSQIINPGGGSGSSAYSSITAGSNTAAKTEGTSGSLAPLNLGQVAATQIWSNVAFANPVLSVNVSGGSLSSAHNIFVEYTLVSALGETDPSGITLITTASCTGGNQCQVVVTAPNIPPGFTGYTVYGCDGNGATSCVLAGTTIQKQTANSACVNITGNCNINVGAASGIAPPTTNTAYVQPTPQGTNTCSPNTQPIWFVADTTNTFYPWLGIDASNTGSNPGTPYTRLAFCRPFWYNDNGTDPPGGQNAAVLVSHLQNGAIINTASNQDRSLFVAGQNAAGDSSAHYGLEALQAQESVVGTPTITGSPDGEIAAGSFQLSYGITSNIASTLGSNGIRITNFRQTGAGVDTGGMSGIYSATSTVSSLSGGGTIMSPFRALCGGSGGVAIGCANFLISNSPTATGAFPSGLFGIRVNSDASFTPTFSEGSAGVIDALIYNLQRNWVSDFNGPIYATTIQSPDQAVLPINSSISVLGGVKPSTITAPVMTNAPTCSGGASQYTYVLVGIDVNGGKKAGAAHNTNSTCVNPLTVGNPVTILAGVPYVNTGVVAVEVWRTGGPMATGKIGTYTCAGTNNIVNFCGTFVDNGLSAVTTEGTTPPATDTTGTSVSSGLTLGGQNTVQVSGSDFVTANNTSLQTITGLTWNLLPGAARNYAFSCDLAYSQGTANVAVAFGIQAATNNPTNIFAVGTQQITVGPPATYTAGTLATLATTSATNIVSGTPGATATNYTVHLAGTIENPATTQNVINVMVSTATGTDAVTVKRGSSCSIHP
jgi:hypothetical protein